MGIKEFFKKLIGSNHPSLALDQKPESHSPSVTVTNQPETSSAVAPKLYNNGKKRAKKRYWSYAECLDEARKAQTPFGWDKLSLASRVYASRRGWYRGILEVVREEQIAEFGYTLGKDRWSIALCREEASKYESKAQWAKGSPKSYKHARRNGWLKDCYRCLGLFVVKKDSVDSVEMPTADEIKTQAQVQSPITLGKEPKSWDFFEVRKVAKKFASEKDWKEASPSSYQYALENKFVHCLFPENYLLQPCMEDAKRFSSRMEWKRKSYREYRRAQRNGWLDLCCAHMVRPLGKEIKWTHEACKAEALRFETRNAWSDNSQCSYSAAKKHGWFEECVKHMPIPSDAVLKAKRSREQIWTFELCLEEARKAGTAGKWQKESPSSRVQAFKRGWYHEIMMIVKTEREQSTQQAEEMKCKAS